VGGPYLWLVGGAERGGSLTSARPSCGERECKVAFTYVLSSHLKLCYHNALSSSIGPPPSDSRADSYDYRGEYSLT
jgi:hypothetical protein